MTKEDYLKQPFIENYLEYSQFQESPDDYHLWVALILMAAATKRKIWFDQVYFKVYTNLYVCLVSRSAISRKSVPMDMGMELYIEALDSNLETTIMGKVTPAKIVSRLVPKEEDPKGVLFAQADELALFLAADVKQAGLIDLLTSLYTCKNIYQYETKKAGTYLLKNIFINILAGTVPSYLQSHIGDVEEEGFIGRFSFILAEGRKNSFPRLKNTANPELVSLLKKVLIEQLRRIAKKEGEVKFCYTAGRIFDSWYNDIPKKGGIAGSANTTGFLGRKGDHGLKLSMLLCLSDSVRNKEIKELRINDNNIYEAIKLVEGTEVALKEIFDKATKKGTPLELLPMVESFMMKWMRTSQKLLGQNFSRKILSEDMTKILIALSQGQVIFSILEGTTKAFYFIPEEFRDLEKEEMRERVIERWRERGRK